MDILPREGRISEQVPGSGVGERLGERLGKVDGGEAGEGVCVIYTTKLAHMHGNACLPAQMDVHRRLPMLA